MEFAAYALLLWKTGKLNTDRACVIHHRTPGSGGGSRRGHTDPWPGDWELRDWRRP
jgi:hypothetical protein